MFVKVSVLLFLSTCHILQASTVPFGVVTKVRGKVSVLKPHAKTADLLKVGDHLEEDTSILTHAKSFARIKLTGKSLLNIGPNSKVILKSITKSDSTLLSLLKGQVRAKITSEKNKKKSDLKHKFLIKTTTAAIGVRGTEFHSIHNPKNNVTSLISYEGDVKIVKLDKDPLIQVIKENDIKEIARSKISKGVMESIDKTLDSKDSETVKIGQFSASVPKESKVSQAVKISPVQLTVLYKNKDLVIKDRNIAPPEDSVIRIKEKDLLTQADQAPPLEGFRDKMTGDYAPRSGGFIDLNTGYYIEPNAESALDSDRLLYVAEKIGRIDKTTGQYKAPMGMKLDPVKGFTIDERVKKALDANQLMIVTQTQKRLNKNLISDPIKVKAPPQGLPQWAYTTQELLEKDQFLFSYSPGSHGLKTKKHQGNDPDFNLDSESSHKFNVTWFQPGLSNWRMTIGAGFQFIKFKSQPGISNLGPRRYHNLDFGLLSYLNESWSIHPRLSLQQRPFLTTNDNASEADRKIVNVTIPSISVGLINRHFFKKKWGLETSIRPSLSLPKGFSTMRANVSYGISLNIMAQYWRSANSYFGLGPYMFREAGATGGSSYDFSRSEGGIVFNYGLIL